MWTVEKFCKTDDCIKRRTDLVTHVQQEGTLQFLCLLSLLRLLHQLPLSVDHLRVVAKHAEIVADAAILPFDGNHAEGEEQVTSLLVVETGLNGRREVSRDTVVHTE